MSLPQPRREPAPPGPADDVADEENPASVGLWDRLAFPAVCRGSATDAGEAPPRAIEAVELTKSFGERRALQGVSFTAAPGELLAIIGPNGAARRRCSRSSRGSAPIRSELHLPNGEVGFVPQQAALYRRLTVAENLRLFARLEGLDDVEAAVEEMLEVTALGERRDDQVGTLSGGNQQRINIAIGLLSKPAALLLDEPSTGLDPRQRQRLWEFVLELAGEGTTVIFSTHNIAEAERYGERMLVIADGERIFDGTAAELHAAAPGDDGPGTADFESAFVRFLSERGH